MAMRCSYQIITEPEHNKTNKMICAPSEDSDLAGLLFSQISLHCLHEDGLVL